jgi:hypothetical protein
MTPLLIGCRTRPRCGSRWLLRDDGSTTLETAIVIPLLTAIAAAFLGILGWAWGGFTSGTAVQEAARAVARGDDQWMVHQHLQSALPEARIYWSVTDTEVRIRVETQTWVRNAVLGDRWQTVVQEATAPREWSG